MSKTKFEYPVMKLCGKISRHSQVIHACTAGGKQITYLQGDRDLTAHPVTDKEKANRTAFAAKQAKVAARMNPSASTYAADMAAFRAQYDKGFKTFRAYIWSVME